MTDTDTLHQLASASGLRTFVETGTDTGATTAAAASWQTAEPGVFLGDEPVRLVASPMFDRLITIEVEPSRYLNNVAQFLDEPRVTVVHGDSDAILQRLCRLLGGPAFFFLDAHANGPEARGPVECPLIMELTHILAANPVGNVIAIDDLDIIVAQAEGYPSVLEIEQTIASWSEHAYKVRAYPTANLLVADPA